MGRTGSRSRRTYGRASDWFAEEAGTALVGSHREVAERIIEYSRLAITHFILSGYPHLEEAYWFGDGVLPILQRKGLWTHPHSPATGSIATPFTRASTN